MNVFLDEDRIINISGKGNVTLSQPLPKGVGLERIRVVDGAPVDLAALDKIWVRHKDGVFDLHAMAVDSAQLVTMTYGERGKLAVDNGVIRLKTVAEVGQEDVAAHNNLLKTKLRNSLNRSIGDAGDQFADLSKLVYVLVDYVLTNSSQAGTLLNNLLPTMQGTYDQADTEARLHAGAAALKQALPDYYTGKL